MIILPSGNEIKKRNLAEENKKIIYKNIASLIKNKNSRKELIDLLNKHIEHQFNDKLPRVRYGISDVELSIKVNKFIKLNNKKFNSDLAVLVHRNMVNTSHADGYTPFFKNYDGVANEVNNIATQQSQLKSESEKGQDAITLSLINQGITKGQKFNGNIVLFIILLLIVGIGIYFLLKNKGKGKIETSNMHLTNTEHGGTISGNE